MRQRDQFPFDSLNDCINSNDENAAKDLGRLIDMANSLRDYQGTLEGALDRHQGPKMERLLGGARAELKTAEEFIEAAIGKLARETRA